MMDWLRARPGARGLVTAVGWYLTKHAVGVYGTTPPATPWRGAAHVQEEVERTPPVVVARDPVGRAVIETYTVVHGRDGGPEHGVVFGRLEDDRRIVACLPDDPTLLDALTRSEGIGLHGWVRTEAGVTRFEPG
jgi:acetyl-CoA C-acetyltransferase